MIEGRSSLKSKFIPTNVTLLEGSKLCRSSSRWTLTAVSILREDYGNFFIRKVPYDSLLGMLGVSKS